MSASSALRAYLRLPIDTGPSVKPTHRHFGAEHMRRDDATESARPYTISPLDSFLIGLTRSSRFTPNQRVIGAMTSTDE